MNLSFSTNGWLGFTWEGFWRMATEYGFNGIELHDNGAQDFAQPGGPLDPLNSQATQRQLRDTGLTIPCIDAICNIANPSALEENCAAVEACVESCAGVGAPYVRLTACRTDGRPAEEEDEAVRCLLRRVLPEAEKAGVTLLLETFDIYADTRRLRNMLDSFANDNLAALWDMQHPTASAARAPRRRSQTSVPM
jgi:fatty-acyl-CoA synthase